MKLRVVSVNGNTLLLRALEGEKTPLEGKPLFCGGKRIGKIKETIGREENPLFVAIVSNPSEARGELRA
jgi:rRNA processing protein Gar1